MSIESLPAGGSVGNWMTGMHCHCNLYIGTYK